MEADHNNISQEWKLIVVCPCLLLFVNTKLDA